MLDQCRRMTHYAGGKNLVIGQLHVLPDDEFVLMADVGRLEQIGLRIDRQQHLHDVRERNVVSVRPVPAAPAQVVSNPLRRDVAQSVIEGFHAQRTVALVRLQSHLDADSIPERREPCVVDLEEESRLRDRFVLDAHGVRERKHELFLRRVILVLTPGLEARGSRRREEGIAGRGAADGRLQAADLALQEALTPVRHRADAGPIQQPPLVRRPACLLEQRTAVARGLIELGELLPVRALGQQLGGRRGRAGLEAGEPVGDETDPVAALGELTLVDDVDAGGALGLHDVANRGAELLLIDAVRLPELGGHGERANVSGQDSIGAASHVGVSRAWLRRLCN